MKPACAHCQDTGRSPGSDSLDCTRCGVAVERAEFECWLATQRGQDWNVPDDTAWAIYQRSKVPAWQPIESAPHHVMLLLACEFDRPGDWRIKCGVNTEESGWKVFGASWIPTHWIPLPPPPEGEKE